MIVTVSIQNDAGRVRVGLQQCRCAYVNYLSISMQAPVIILWANIFRKGKSTLQYVHV